MSSSGHLCVLPWELGTRLTAGRPFEGVGVAVKLNDMVLDAFAYILQYGFEA